MTPAPPGGLKAITFDFWDTLVRQNPSSGQRRRDLFALELASHGITPTTEELDALMADGWALFEQRWRAGSPMRSDEWTVWALERLGLAADHAVAERFVAIIDAGTEPAQVNLAPNVVDTLRGLKDKGLRIGIICDVGLTPSTTLRRYLDHHGALELFDHWSFSDEVGVFKPDQRIFAHALDGLGVVASEAAHIGDLRRTDVAGGRAAGLRTLRYRGIFDDPGSVDDGTHELEADHVVDDHAELLELI